MDEIAVELVPAFNPYMPKDVDPWQGVVLIKTGAQDAQQDTEAGQDDESSSTRLVIG